MFLIVEQCGKECAVNLFIGSFIKPFCIYLLGDIKAENEKSKGKETRREQTLAEQILNAVIVESKRNECLNCGKQTKNKEFCCGKCRKNFNITMKENNVPLRNNYRTSVRGWRA